MWIIDKDYMPEEGVAPGTNMNATGVKSADYSETRTEELTERFRLLDDDGNIYYEGRSTDSESQDAFNPIDDFGGPNAGCTIIEYLRDGKWVTL